MNSYAETSPKTKARITAILYLITLVAAVIAEGLISSRFDSGDPTTTAARIVANPSLYTAGFSTYMIEMAAQIAMTALFYELLKPVSKGVASLSAVFGYVGCGIKIVARLFYIAPLLVVGGVPMLKGFSEAQLDSIALLLLKINDRGAGIALIFFGFSTLLKAWLIIKSTFLPRWLGVLSFVAGIGWLAFLSPLFGLRIYPFIGVIGLLGSLATIAWLLAFGVDENRWREQAAVAATSIWR